jgi:hypothetical protein
MLLLSPLEIVLLRGLTFLDKKDAEGLIKLLLVRFEENAEALSCGERGEVVVTDDDDSTVRRSFGTGGVEDGINDGVDTDNDDEDPASGPVILTVGSGGSCGDDDDVLWVWGIPLCLMMS